MKTTPVAVPSGDPPLGFKHPPTLIGEKNIDPSVIALRARNYAAAYAEPLMRQKWNMYVSSGIQQFVSLHNYVSHRAQETVDGRYLHLARYYHRYHLENLPSVDTYLIRTMGVVEKALAISHPGYFDMSSTIDMDKYVVESLPKKEMDIEIDIATPPTNETVKHDDLTLMDTMNATSSGCSSLAKAASTGSSSDKSGMRFQANAEETPPQNQQDDFIAVPMSPMRANATDDDEVTDESVPTSPKSAASSPKKAPPSSPKKASAFSPKTVHASSPKKVPASPTKKASAVSTSAKVPVNPPSAATTASDNKVLLPPKTLKKILSVSKQDGLLKTSMSYGTLQQKCIFGLHPSCLVSILKLHG